MSSPSHHHAGCHSPTAAEQHVIAALTHRACPHWSMSSWYPHQPGSGHRRSCRRRHRPMISLSLQIAGQYVVVRRTGEMFDIVNVLPFPAFRGHHHQWYCYRSSRVPTNISPSASPPMAWPLCRRTVTPIMEHAVGRGITSMTIILSIITTGQHICAVTAFQDVVVIAAVQVSSPAPPYSIVPAPQAVH